MSAQVAAVRRVIAAVLALHYRESTGMTYGTPDRCACQAETRPEPGEEDVTVRRARAFAQHQADEVIAALEAAADAAEADQ